MTDNSVETAPKKKFALKPVLKKTLIVAGIVVGTALTTLLLTKRSHESDEPHRCVRPRGG